MTHVHHFAPTRRPRQLATAPGGGRSVSAASCGPGPTAATVADFSLATTVAPADGTRHCNNAASDALAEIFYCSPSADTAGFAGVVWNLSFVVRLGLEKDPKKPQCKASCGTPIERLMLRASRRRK